MTHPNRGAAKASAKGKFKNMLGSSKGAKHTDEQTNPTKWSPGMTGVDDVKIMGHPTQKRLDRARGGKVSKGATVVNVIVKGGDDKPPPPVLPPMPPPTAGPPPPPMGKPPMAPPIPGGPPPGMMMRKSGGQVKAGAGSGVGRLNRQNKLNIKGK